MPLVELTELWLPILLSGVAVFVLSFLMWMVMPHHKGDWEGLPDEDGLMDALRAQGVKPKTQYMFPYCHSQELMKDPEWMAKFNRGPKGFLVMKADGEINMGKNMVISTIFNLLTATLVALVATLSVERGAAGADVFWFVTLVAFLANSWALVWGAIWFDRTWGSTLREMFDGLVYGAATGAIFMLLWPALG